MKRITIVVGTRPEIIKVSPVVRACEGSGAEWFMAHTGQDCSCDVSWVFSGGLGLPGARYNPDVESMGHGSQTGSVLAGIEKTLIAETPDVVLVEGDMNTVLAGALAASKLHIKVGHVEAGLRGHQ